MSYRTRTVVGGMAAALMVLLSGVVLSSCKAGRYMDEGELYLRKNILVSEDPKATKPLLLEEYIRQSPNKNWFGMKVPLGIYCLSGNDTTKWFSRLMRKIGEKPVVYDSRRMEQTKEDIRQVMVNAGYMDAEVVEEIDSDENSVTLTYRVRPNNRYIIRSVRKDIEDPEIRRIIEEEDSTKSLIRPGTPFNINNISEERNRISSMLRSIGYYRFNKEFITYTADTCAGAGDVDITVRIGLFQANSNAEKENHHKYMIGDVKYTTVDGWFRPSVLLSNTLLLPGKYFNETDEKLTYRYFTRLDAVSYSNITLTEREDSDVLDCNITVYPAKRMSLGLDIEGTNTAGDLGAAASTTFTHRNLFKGSETLNAKLRGAYEAISGLEGYEGESYLEFGSEVGLAFPGFLLPYVKKSFGAIHAAKSEVSVQFNFQNRPEFHRRVFSAAWRYRWNSLDQKYQHKFDLLEVNYVRMPWISKTFKEQYLDSIGKTNTILKYNYEDILITKLGYSFTYNSLGSATMKTYGKNAYTLRANIETSGNLLGLVTPWLQTDMNSNGQRTFLGIAFAQYVKGDFDFAKSIRIDKNNSVAMRFALGVAYPYGNSDILPFEKRYFSGGANSVRGWSVRSLGPGSYSGADRDINFINQSGDIKLDLSLEYRAFLFWKLNGAIFLDGGNIWTIREYKDQPGGGFKVNSFLRDIAFSYGLGLRMDLDFFILRFDAGMKAINPAYEGRNHYPIIHPDLNRDFAFHFAVGLPF
ncbi:MAG: BamA/TamA family outer membrane protein [Bacteroidaceae bacterium]|nr:BamA/TamA family outer membrane protein [Bacteroidaceae bacterium]